MEIWDHFEIIYLFKILGFKSCGRTTLNRMYTLLWHNLKVTNIFKERS